MVVGVDVAGSAWDPTLTVKWTGARIARVFCSPGEGLKPWSVVRFTSLPQTVAPHVSWKDWPDDTTVTGWITSFLDTMPAYLSAAPLLPELGFSMAMSWYHEPESSSAGGVGAAEYARRYGVLYSVVKGHSLGHLVAVVPIQTQYWTVVHGGGDVTTWWPGSDRADGCGLDCYNDMTGAAYQDPSAFLTAPFALRDYTGLPLWVPELGSRLYSVDGSGNPLDTTGELRAAWITGVAKGLEKGRCAAASYWDSLATNGDMRLLDQPSIDAWAGVIANGGHDLARHSFGDTLADFAIDSTTVSGTANVVVLQPGATVTLWTDQTGGTQVTDLAADENGITPLTQITTSDGTDGRHPGQIPTFWGPDAQPEVYDLWASANGGPRQHLISPDVEKLAATVATLNANLQAHLSDFSNPHQTTAASLADADFTTAPVAGDVFTYNNAGKWQPLAPSQVAGAVLLNPTLSGGNAGNTVPLDTNSSWLAGGSAGAPWVRVNVPYSNTDSNPDVWQYRAGLPGGGGANVKTSWTNGNGEFRTSPSWPSRIGFRAFEMLETAGLGPSTGRFFEISTNPTNSSLREALLGAYGTGHSTKPGWIEATRIISALKGVWAGGTNGLNAVMLAGVLSTAGPPTSGTWSTNTLILDADGVLWYCSAGGAPGTWITASALYGAFTDIASLGTNVTQGTPHAQSRTAPGSRVELQGQMSITGSISANTTLFTLPAGQLPASAVVFTIRFSGPSAATQLFTLNTSGQFSCTGSLANGNAFNLDGLSFQHV